MTLKISQESEVRLEPTTFRSKSTNSFKWYAALDHLATEALCLSFILHSKKAKKQTRQMIAQFLPNYLRKSSKEWKGKGDSISNLSVS